MKRRSYLAAITAASCAGCAQPNFDTFGESDSGDSTRDTESTTTTKESESADSTEEPTEEEPTEEEPTEEGPDLSELPVIHELSLDYDENWMMMTREYEVPNAGDEFTITEKWHITDTDGATVLKEEKEETIETERDRDSVLVSGGTWIIPRWDNNIQRGEYTVELTIVGTGGSESNPERRTIFIDTDPAGSIDQEDSGERDPDSSELPVIHGLSLDHDENWMMMTREYEVPNAGNEFTITEKWHITDAGGATVYEEQRQEVVEAERDIESVLVSGGTLYIPRRDYNIQQGKYTVELVIVGAEGSKSNSERRTISIDTEMGE